MNKKGVPLDGGTKPDSAETSSSIKTQPLSFSTTNPDSKTNVYMPVPMEREVVSIRVRPEIKQALKRYCLANGTSICHVFEGLVIGLLVGVNEQIEFVNKSPTINLYAPRMVKRVRRYVKEVAEEVEYLVTVYCPLEDRTCKVEDLACLCKEQPSCINKACFQRVLQQTEEGEQPQRNDDKLERALGHKSLGAEK